MEFGILGPLRVTTEDGERSVGGAKARTVLALLVLRANQTVSTDALVDALWEAEPPRSAIATLQTYVYQLRKNLDLDVLLTRPTGYTLEVTRASVDALRFEDAVRGATGAEAHETAARLGEALAWWRGPALADFDGAAWARADATRLDALRLETLERLLDARLALGQHRAVVPELESVVAAYPLRERFAAQLMLALYRSDRQADALRAYTRVREHLRDELGLEPSRELVELEAAILAHAPELAPPPTPDLPADATPRPPASRPGRRALVGLAVVAVAIVGAVLATSHSRSTRAAVAGPAGYTPSYRTASCPPAIGGDASAICGVLTVPENRQRPGGRKIELGVFRFPSRATHPADDPIVQLGSDFHLPVPAGDTSLRVRSDSIYLSGRGFFGSTPRLTCPEVEDAVKASLARPLRDPVNTVEFVRAAARCRARWVAQHVDLSAYSAAERADDVRDLALALHLKRIDLVAAGPMTNDAREIAGRYPGLVRSITLFNVTPNGPDANRWNGEITNAAAALDRFAGECANDSRCNRVYPHLRRRFADVYNHDERSPRTFAVANPFTRTRERVPVLLDGDREVQLTLLALDDPGAPELIPQAFASTANSGPAVADFAASRLLAPRDASWGALLSRICVDEIGSLGLGGMNLEGQAAPRLAFLADDPVLEACRAWRTAPAASHTAGPGVTPTLILEGDLDPFTSREWAQQVAQSFGRATVVELPHLGRVASSSDPCVLRLRAGFLADPQRRIDADACPRSIPPVHFAGT
jgi:DNA-binding SARP family transcriptional activator